MYENIIIGKSIISGIGVFANRDFKKGEIVLHWDISNSLSKNRFDSLSSDEKRYVCHLNDKNIMMQEPERYVNHSCNSNTKSIDFCDVAIRDIKKGEEITSNYADTTPSGVINFKCNCGSKNCINSVK